MEKNCENNNQDVNAKEPVLHVFYAANRPLYWPALVGMAAAAEKLSRPAVFHLLVAKGAMSKNEDRLRGPILFGEAVEMLKASLNVADFIVDEVPVEMFSELRIWENYTVEVFFRLAIHWLYPELDKAVYLDVDTLVLDDLYKMVSEINFEENHVFAACQNCFHKALLNGIDHDGMHNFGVAVLRPKMVAERFSFETVKEVFLRLQNVQIEQDERLFFFWAKENGLDYFRLNQRWNTFQCWCQDNDRFPYLIAKEIEESGVNPGIVHLVGQGKPWAGSNEVKDGFKPFIKMWKDFERNLIGTILKAKQN